MAQRWRSLRHRGEQETTGTPGWSPARGNGRVDPISVAFAALSSDDSDHGRQSATDAGAGERVRAGFHPDRKGEPVDPLAVTRAALEEQSQSTAARRGEEGSATPLRERFGHLVGRARSVIGSGDGQPESEATSQRPEGDGMETGKTEEEATPAGSASGSHEASPDDPGWVFHRRTGEGGHEGWLYHYADGTMVSEDGTVYEYPSHDSDALGQDPSAEDDTSDGGPGGDRRSGESPTQVSGAHEKAPSEPPADREARQDTETNGTETETETDTDTAPEAKGSESDAAAEAESEQETDDKAQDKTDDQTPHEDGGSDEDPAVPEVEGSSGGPVAAATDAVAGVWLRDKAKGKETLEGTDEGGEDADDSSSETVHIPAFIEYSPTNLLRYVSGALFALAALAAVLTIFYAVQAESAPHFILGGVFVLIALLASWVLLSWEPTVISIREGILEVAKGPQGEQVDLRDPRTDVEIGHNVSSPTWKTVVHRSGAKDIKIRAGQVKARQFAAIVEHYVSHPRKQPLDEDD